MSPKSDDPYDIKVTQDPDDPTFFHFSMKLPAGMVARCEPGLIDLPENPTIQSTEEARKYLSDAIADWMTRGNMRHEDKSDPRVWSLKMIEAAQSQVLAEEVDREQAELMRPIFEKYEQVEAAKRAAQEDTEPRPKGCQCQWEAGDSPCPVHGEESE